MVGELVPKRIARNAPEAIASAIARPMRLLATITAPLVAILTLTTEGVLRVVRVHASGEPALTEEDVRLLIVQGTEAGVIQAGERQVVEAAFELGDREVRELMTPRVLVTSARSRSWTRGCSRENGKQSASLLPGLPG